MKEVIFIKKLLNPKNDYVFKRIFGYTGNEDITKSLLSSIIPDNIEEITLDCNPITEKDLFDDKVGILDIKAKLNNSTNCNIYEQVEHKKRKIATSCIDRHVGNIYNRSRESQKLCTRKQ